MGYSVPSLLSGCSASFFRLKWSLQLRTDVHSLCVCAHLYLYFSMNVCVLCNFLFALSHALAALCCPVQSQRSLQQKAHVNHLCESKPLLHLYIHFLLPKASIMSPAECHVFISDSHILIVRIRLCVCVQLQARNYLLIFLLSRRGVDTD